MRIPLGYGRADGFVVARGLEQTSLGVIPTGAAVALLRAETQDVRWRDDGTDPTTADGFLLRTTDPPLEYHGPLTAFRFVGVTFGAVLHVGFYGLG